MKWMAGLLLLVLWGAMSCGAQGEVDYPRKVADLERELRACRARLETLELR